jgi:multidrug efflux pump subunit AcrA (membrane-fusion protein)
MLEAQNEPPQSLVISVEPLTDPTGKPLPLRDLPARAAHLWRQRKFRLVAVTAGVVLLALGAGLGAFVAGNHVEYASAHARVGNLALTVHAAGMMTAPAYAVDSTVAGTLDSIDVSVGQQVEAGDTLAEVNAPALVDAVSQAQAAADSAQTTVSDVTALQSATQDDANAANTAAYSQEQAALYACGHPTGTPQPNCADAATAAYNAVLTHSAAQMAMAQASVDSAETQLTLANAALQTAQHALDAATLLAPHSGTVTAIRGQVGAPVGPGAYANGGPLITIEDFAAMLVRAQVPQSEADQVQEGQVVAFTAAAYPKHTFRGTVSDVSSVANLTSSGLSFPVTIDVDMVGLDEVSVATEVPVDVTIYLAQRYNVVLVPEAAVTYAHQLLSGVLTPRKGAARDPSAPSAADVRKAYASANLLASESFGRGPEFGTDTPTAAVLVARGKHGWVLLPVLLGLSDGKQVVVMAGLKSRDVVVTGQHTVFSTLFTDSGSGAAAPGKAGDTPRLFGS